jgi:hypothetical protein
LYHSRKNTEFTLFTCSNASGTLKKEISRLVVKVIMGATHNNEDDQRSTAAEIAFAQSLPWVWSTLPDNSGELVLAPDRPTVWLSYRILLESSGQFADRSRLQLKRGVPPFLFAPLLDGFKS